MRILPLAAFSALLLLVPSAPTAGVPKFLESVRPLMVPVVEMAVTEQGVIVDGALQNICTVSSINEKRHYWLTAAHCIEQQDFHYYIMGEEVSIVMRDVANDVAILQTSQVSLKALKLAKKGPEMGDIVQVGGHPFGWLYSILATGQVMHPSLQPWPKNENPIYRNYWMILDMRGAPGNSGSPVVNKKSEVISVVQIGWGVRDAFGNNLFGNVMGGVPFEVLAKNRNYWE